MPEANADLEKLEISFPVASETPYRRYDWCSGSEYLEVLRCNSDAIDMTRLNAGASVLKNHDPDEIIGTVIKAWIEDARLWVRVKMRQADESIRNLFADMADGIVRNVSIGYTQDDVERDGEYGYVTRWTPLEVSMAVGVPADPTVGLYRSADIADKKILTRNLNDNCNKEDNVENIDELKKELEDLKKEIEELKNMQQEGTPAAEEKAEEPAPAEDAPADAEKAEEPAPAEGAPAAEEKAEEPAETPAAEEEKENCDADEIRSMGSIASVPTSEVESCIKRNMSAAEFRNHIKTLNLNVRKDNKMSNNYSFFRALQAAAGLNVDASFERQESDRLYQSIGRSNSNANSIMVRANEFLGSDAGAGLIGTEHRGDMFVELLRTKMGVKGFTALTGLRSNIEIPVQTGSIEAEIKGINDTLTTQKPTVSTINLAPKKFGATVTVGKDLLAQSNPDAAAFVMRDIEAQIARKLDAAILVGNADPEITGVKGTTGVQTVEIADLASATWKDMVKFFGKIGSYDLGSVPQWVMTASDAQTFKGISKDAGGGRFIMEDGQIDGFDVNISGTIPAGNIFLGNWADVLVGQWGGLEIIVDPYTKAPSGMLVITATLLADVGVRNPEGFVIRTA